MQTYFDDKNQRGNKQFVKGFLGGAAAYFVVIVGLLFTQAATIRAMDIGGKTDVSFFGMPIVEVSKVASGDGFAVEFAFKVGIGILFVICTGLVLAAVHFLSKRHTTDAK